MFQLTFRRDPSFHPIFFLVDAPANARRSATEPLSATYQGNALRMYNEHALSFLQDTSEGNNKVLFVTLEDPE